MTPNRLAVLTLAALAAACRPAPDTGAVENRADAGDVANAPEADINESLGLDLLAGSENHMAAPQGYGGIPPDDRALRFVGRWAAEEPLCRTQAWRFTADGLETPGASVCRFGDITPVEGGYDIAARCSAEAPERADTIRLRFAESAHAMLFESDVIADTGLVYCGPDE